MLGFNTIIIQLVFVKLNSTTKVTIIHEITTVSIHYNGKSCGAKARKLRYYFVTLRVNTIFAGLFAKD